MTKTSDFDWVQARTDCSLPTVFQRLKLQIKAGADARTETLLKNDAGFGFSTVSEGASISVVLQGKFPLKSIVFTLTESGISVRDGDDNLTFDAILTLDDGGQCRLKVGTRELEFWQFRRLALEGLLFDNPRR